MRSFGNDLSGLRFDIQNKYLSLQLDRKELDLH